MRKFPFTALCEITADGVVSMPVRVGALFAPTQGLLFISTLHWCKHSTGLEGAPNLRKFPLTALFEIAADGVVSKPVLVGTLFAPTQGLHFQTLHPLSFVFMRILHWCKHCTGLEVDQNLRKFPLTAIYAKL